jgi:hypothetical protein
MGPFMIFNIYFSNFQWLLWFGIPLEGERGNSNKKYLECNKR